MKELSFVIPVFNEEKILENETTQMVAEINRVFHGVDYEIFLVENGSTDNTPAIVDKLAHTFSTVRVVHLLRSDYGLALKHCLLESQGKYVVIFNIDFWDVEFARCALEKMRNSSIVLVVGSKSMPGAGDKRPWLRRLVTRGFNGLLRTFFGFRGTDTHGLKVLVAKQVMPVITECQTDGVIFDTEFVLRAQKMGLASEEMPVVCEEKRKTRLKMFTSIFQTLRDLVALYRALNNKKSEVMEDVGFIKKVFSVAKKNQTALLLLFAIIFMLIFSAITLTTKPAFWYDEGINIELARNFSLYGQLDLIVEPLIFSGIGPNIGSTGYPTTIPLALVFKIFGFGLVQARIYMLLWMSVCLISTFYFAKQYWGTGVAVAVVFLFASFPPFYGNGRSVMGEIPGFIFLLFSLWYLLCHKRFFISGILLGLAVISKPSVYFFFIIAYVLFLLTVKKNTFRKVIFLLLGSLIPFFGWIAIYSRNESTISLFTWKQLLDHFSNPYQQAGITVMQNIKTNLLFFLHSPTLLYFSILVILVLAASIVSRDFYQRNKSLLLITGFYSIFSFGYFLKSLGYLRYLIATQLLVFFLVVPAIQALIKRLSVPYQKFVIVLFVGTIIGTQTFYLFTHAKLFYSHQIQDTFIYIQQHFPDQTVGIIDLPPLASLISPDKKFQIISTYGLEQVGPHPLSLQTCRQPEVLVLDKKEFVTGEYQNVLSNNYSLDTAIGGKIMIYKRANRQGILCH